MVRHVADEIRPWRWAWVGVVIAVVMPPLYLWHDSTQHALFALIVGVAFAAIGRASDHRTG